METSGTNGRRSPIRAISERSWAGKRPLTTLAWSAFGGLVAVNAIWLVVTLVAPQPPLHAEEAYAKCRETIRRMRPEAARIRFPTGDLIRVTRRDSVHQVVRGYYVVPAATVHTNYVCELTALPGSLGFKVDTIVFQP